MTRRYINLPLPLPLPLH